LRRKVPSNLHLGVLSPLPTSEFYNKDVTIAGWGCDETNRIPDHMRTVKLRVIEIHECRNTVAQLNGSPITIQSRHICTNANPFAVMHWVSIYFYQLSMFSYARIYDIYINIIFLYYITNN
jgi:hypothetical protein